MLWSGFVFALHACFWLVNAGQTCVRARKLSRFTSGDFNPLLTPKIQDCVAAGRLFGFDVFEEFSRNQTSPKLIQPPNTALMASIDKSVKNTIIDIIKRASPQPVRAKDIQSEIETIRGEPLHYKTVGMTLYRLSKDGIVRRDGWDWFYVPQKDETAKGATEAASDGEVLFNDLLS